MSGPRLILCLACLLIAGASIGHGTAGLTWHPRVGPATATLEPLASQQETRPTHAIRVDVGLVVVPIVVLDREGRHVSDLDRAAFHVYQDGVEQKIVSFESDLALLHVAVLLDTSQSTRTRLQEMKRAALRFLDTLQGQCRVMIVSFDSLICVEAEFTDDLQTLRKAVEATRTGRLTRMYDAVDLVVRERLRQISGRKALVLFGDGVDTYSRLSNPNTVESLIEESNLVVYPVRFDTEGTWRPPTSRFYSPENDAWTNSPQDWISSKPEYRAADEYLRRLAQSTGGRYLSAGKPEELHAAFDSVAEELSRQYSISYYPSNAPEAGTFHKISVTVDRPDLVVRSRSGYRVPRGASQPATRD